MYEGAVISVRSAGRISDEFLVTVELYQRSRNEVP